MSFAFDQSDDLREAKQEVEYLRQINADLLTACKAALVFVEEVAVEGCRIELILKSAIAKAEGVVS